MTDTFFPAGFARWVPTLFLVVLALLVSPVASATAQEVAVPVETQAALFTRILAFDRAFDHRRDKDLVIGILYQERFRASLNVKNLLVELSERDTATRQPVHRYVPIDMTEAGALRAALARHSIDVLYVAPLRAVNIDDIVAVSRVLVTRVRRGLCSLLCRELLLQPSEVFLHLLAGLEGLE